MTINNFKNKYLQVTSSFIDDLINNPANYASLQVIAKIGCDGVPVTETLTATDIVNAPFVADLNEAVALQDKIYQINIKNIYSQKEYNVIGSAIDLSYITTNCTNPSGCTLQDFSDHFAPLFKSAIDSWFSSKSIASDVTVTFVGNQVQVLYLPSAFVLTQIGYAKEDITPYLLTVFGYLLPSSHLFFSDNSFYIAPSIFVPNTSDIEDGVYNITIRLTKVNNGGYITESMCAFLDNKSSCMVAISLNSILGDEGKLSEEAMSLLQLHYGLVVGSNCGCNCEDLCKLYTEMMALIDAISDKFNDITTDCGC